MAKDCRHVGEPAVELCWCATARWAGANTNTDWMKCALAEPGSRATARVAPTQVRRAPPLWLGRGDPCGRPAHKNELHPFCPEPSLYTQMCDILGAGANLTIFIEYIALRLRK